MRLLKVQLSRDGVIRILMQMLDLRRHPDLPKVNKSSLAKGECGIIGFL